MSKQNETASKTEEKAPRKAKSRVVSSSLVVSTNLRAGDRGHHIIEEDCDNQGGDRQG
jgi:hypothetical protein